MSTCSQTPVATPWRLRIDGALPGEINMRIDANLLEEQRSSEAWPLLRFFQWDATTLSYGRLQDKDWVRGVTQAAQRRGPVNVVERPTGGGAVMHRNDLSVSLAWRRDHGSMPSCLKEVYRRVHDAARHALAADGYAISFYEKPTDAPKQIPGFCFTEPADNDLMWHGRKVMGGALRVTGWGRLYQGNILLDALNWPADQAIKRLTAAFSKHFFLMPPLPVRRTAKTC